MIGGNGTNHLGVNLSYTRFLFITPKRDDESTMGTLRAVATCVARGYFNDFEAEGTREGLAQESIQFLTSVCTPATFCSRPRFVLQISSKYRPRLQETDQEFRRRLGDVADVSSLDGAIRVPQYTSAEMYAYAYTAASARVSGRQQHNVIIIPIRKRRSGGRRARSSGTRTSTRTTTWKPARSSTAMRKRQRRESRESTGASTPTRTATCGPANSTSSPTSSALMRTCRSSTRSAAACATSQ
jgi:hypothetical protein